MISEKRDRTAEVRQRVLDKITRTPLRDTPFPHLYVEDVFPADFYAALLGRLAADKDYTPLEVIRKIPGYYPQRSASRMPSCLLWMRDGGLNEALCRALGVTGVEIESYMVRDKTGYVLPPHTDSPHKIASALFYLARATGEWQGTSLYVPREAGFVCKQGLHHPRENFELVWTAPGAPNSLLAFARTNRSFHGVEPHGSPVARDIVQYNIGRA